MRNTFRRLHGAAIFEFELARRQLMLRVTGPLTPLVLRAVAEDVSRIAQGALSKSIAIDYSAAALAVAHTDLLRAGLSMPSEVRAMPVAIVPPTGAVDLFRDYARQAANEGFVRGIFPGGLEAASDWASRKEGMCPQFPALRSRTLEAAR